MTGDAMPITREDGPLKWNLNTVVMLGGAAVSITAQIVIFAVLWTNQTRDVKDLQNQVTGINSRFTQEGDDRKDRLRDYQATLDGMKSQIATFAPLSYQVTAVINASAENKEAVKQTNARIDRVVESFGGKLDTVIENLNKLATRVEVINSRMLDSTGKTDRTRFPTPIIRP